MADDRMVLPEVTKRIINGQRYTEARLSRDDTRVLCGFKKCDAELARLSDRGAYRELIINPGWKTLDKIHWELTTNSQRRVERGSNPRARKGYVNPRIVEAWRVLPDGSHVQVPLEEARTPRMGWCFVRNACFMPCWKHFRDHGINYLDPAVLGYITELERVDLFIKNAKSDEERALHEAYRAELVAGERSSAYTEHN